MSIITLSLHIVNKWRGNFPLSGHSGPDLVGMRSLLGYRLWQAQTGKTNQNRGRSASTSPI